MPLKTGKSKQAFESNLKEEISSGKPKEQALAIAYAKKREADKRKKMWLGGKVSEDKQDDDLSNDVYEHKVSSGEPNTEDNDDEEDPMFMSDGGLVDDEDAFGEEKKQVGLDQYIEHMLSGRKKMSLGGLVEDEKESSDSDMPPEHRLASMIKKSKMRRY